MLYAIAIYENKGDNEPIMDIEIYGESPKKVMTGIISTFKGNLKYKPANFLKCYKIDKMEKGWRCSYIIN